MSSLASSITVKIKCPVDHDAGLQRNQASGTEIDVVWTGFHAPNEAGDVAPFHIRTRGLLGLKNVFERVDYWDCKTKLE